MTLKDNLINEYPQYKEFIEERWGDPDYYGDRRTKSEMYYNIEIDIQRDIGKDTEQ